LFGLPARLLLTAEPLDDYLRRGLLATDPRTGLDPSAEQLLAGVADAQRRLGTKVGVRLSEVISEPVVEQLHALGFRRFAVSIQETRPLLLALGKAAYAG
jgi:pyruvate, orthophosphate dikinase